MKLSAIGMFGLLGFACAAPLSNTIGTQELQQREANIQGFPSTFDIPSKRAEEETADADSAIQSEWKREEAEEADADSALQSEWKREEADADEQLQSEWKREEADADEELASEW